MLRGGHRWKVHRLGRVLTDVTLPHRHNVRKISERRVEHAALRRVAIGVHPGRGSARGLGGSLHGLVELKVRAVRHDVIGEDPIGWKGSSFGLDSSRDVAKRVAALATWRWLAVYGEKESESRVTSVIRDLEHCECSLFQHQEDFQSPTITSQQQLYTTAKVEK